MAVCSEMVSMIWLLPQVGEPLQGATPQLFGARRQRALTYPVGQPGSLLDRGRSAAAERLAGEAAAGSTGAWDGVGQPPGKRVSADGKRLSADGSRVSDDGTAAAAAASAHRLSGEGSRPGQSPAAAVDAVRFGAGQPAHGTPSQAASVPAFGAAGPLQRLSSPAVGHPFSWHGAPTMDDTSATSEAERDRVVALQEHRFGAHRALSRSQTFSSGSSQPLHIRTGFGSPDVGMRVSGDAWSPFSPVRSPKVMVVCRICEEKVRACSGSASRYDACCVKAAFSTRFCPATCAEPRAQTASAPRLVQRRCCTHWQRCKLAAALQVPADMLEKHSKVCCLLDEEEAQDHSLDARLTK